jgi:hypothetical protein
MHRRDLAKGLLVGGPALVASRAQAQSCTCPSNPYDVRQYGAVGDGVTNDAPAFQAAINLAKTNGGTVLVPMPAVAYLLNSPLDCTTDVGKPTRGFTIRGEASVIAVTTNSPYYPAIIAKHTGHVFDCSGSYGINFYDLNIGTDTTTNPLTCFLLARNSSGNSEAFRFVNVRVYGYFAVSLLYNYGSEDGVYIGCYWFNAKPGNGGKVVTLTSHNVFSQSSSFITIASGAQSCIDHQFFGGQFANLAGVDPADVFYLESVSGVSVFGGWAYNASSSGSGRAIVYVDTTNGPSDTCKFDSILGEHSTFQTEYGFYFGDTAAACAQWTIDSCTVPNAGTIIKSHPLVTFDDFHMRRLDNEGVGGGVAIQGTLQNSSIQTLSSHIAIGTSRNNVLMVPSDTLTVTSRIDDYWIDSSSGNKTWTPDTSGLTVIGTLVVASSKALFTGNMVTLTLHLQASGSISCAAGAAIGGLPATAVGRAPVTVCNATPALLGVGAVSAARIILPAVAATSDLILSVTYPAA